MRVPTVALFALLCGIFLVVGAGPAVGAPAVATADQQLDQQTTQPTGTLEPADPQQLIQISLAEDGDAEWVVESRFLLTDDDDRALFDDYATEVTSGERDGGYDRATFETFAALAAETTDREMRIEDAGWDDARIDSPDTDAAVDEDAEIGVISYSVTWTNFAAIDDDRLRLDAFATADGTTWLPGLTEGQRLVIDRPPNYGLETATTLSWDGPHEFQAGDLEIVFVQTGIGVASSQWILAGIGGLILGAGGYVLVRYLRNPDQQLPFGGSGDDTPAAETEAEEEPPEPTPETPADDGTEIAYEEPADEEIDLELLSDEERVTRLLHQNGGRMKQANIVKETGWSNAKVSQLLSQMHEDDEIDKLRIGRENLITLPDVDPTEVD